MEECRGDRTSTRSSGTRILPDVPSPPPFSFLGSLLLVSAPATNTEHCSDQSDSSMTCEGVPAATSRHNAQWHPQGTWPGNGRKQKTRLRSMGAVIAGLPSLQCGSQTYLEAAGSQSRPLAVSDNLLDGPPVMLCPTWYSHTAPSLLSGLRVGPDLSDCWALQLLLSSLPAQERNSTMAQVPC